MERFSDVLCENIFVNQNYMANSSFADEYIIREETIDFKNKYKKPLFKKDGVGYEE